MQGLQQAFEHHPDGLTQHTIVGGSRQTILIRHFVPASGETRAAFHARMRLLIVALSDLYPAAHLQSEVIQYDATVCCTVTVVQPSAALHATAARGLTRPRRTRPPRRQRRRAAWPVPQPTHPAR